jgi:hypothetical protein
MSQPGRGNPDLLWCPRRPEAAARQLELVSADERRIAITVGDVEAAETVDTAHLLRFWPGDIDGVPEGGSFAADYQQPAELVLARGGLATDIAGDLDRDGYNESDGCYELEPIDGLLRFRFLPAGLLRHRPIFRAHDTVGKECWVYADGRIIGQPDRDLSGNLLFALPHAVTAPVAIELNTHASPFTP